MLLLVLGSLALLAVNALLVTVMAAEARALTYMWRTRCR
jgi:hypothetical protein